MGGHCQYEEAGGHLSGCGVCAYVCVGEGGGVDGGGGEGGLGCQWLSSETCKITFLNDAENMEIRLSYTLVTLLLNVHFPSQAGIRLSCTPVSFPSYLTWEPDYHANQSHSQAT